LKILAGTTGLEPAASCVTDKSKIAILLARLASSSVLYHGFTGHSGVIVPQLFPHDWGDPLRWHNFFVHSFRVE
jgi:hypothetical protein